MKKVIFIILSLSAVACNSENDEDSTATSAYTSKSTERIISINSRSQSWAQKVTGSRFNNLYKVNNDIYRSELPTAAGYNYLQQNNIASILNLRGGIPDNISGTKYAGHLYHVPMDATDVSDEDIIEALQIIKTAPKPMDIHCSYGSDRTGVTLAMYRIIFQNWSKDDASAEMTGGGYGFHPEYTNLVNYIQSVDVNYIKNQVFN
jgi:protein tyrosine/serine phosphatase